MTLKEIYELMDKLDASNLSELEIELGDTRVRLSKAATAVPCVPAPTAAPAAPMPCPTDAQVENAGSFIKAPLVGTFYVAPAPGEAPFVTAGKTVKKGETVCLIEAMKMINEIPAPCDCRIEQVLRADGETVAFDTPIFAIKEL